MFVPLHKHIFRKRRILNFSSTSESLQLFRIRRRYDGRYTNAKEKCE